VRTLCFPQRPLLRLTFPLVSVCVGAQDHAILERRHVFTILMSFYDSKLADKAARTLVLQVRRVVL
jgi:hypothetical protein